MEDRRAAPDRAHVTVDDTTHSLIAAGLDPVDARSRAALVAQAATALEAGTGHAPVWAWFVPGRIEIFGKHTDYAGGRSLVAAVPRGFAVVAHPRGDGRVAVRDARWGDDVTIDPLDRQRTFHGWTNYIAVVARRLALNFPGANLGAEIAIASDLPRAAGVSSSSALVVGIATALARRAELAARAEWRGTILTPLDLAGYLGAVENGLNFKTLSSSSGVGTHGGSEDHTAILTCRAGHVSAYAYVPVRPVGDATMPPHWRFVVAASGIQADKAGTARARYNAASLATRALVTIWNQHTNGATQTLGAALASGPHATAELERRVSGGAGQDGFEAADLTRRLQHFVAEDARVPAALDAFRAGDAETLGQLSDASQHDADTLLGNQVPETRVLARLAREHGAFAASSFGAGFGGSVWALVEEADAHGFADRWLAAYREMYRDLARVEAFTTRPGRGVIELTP
jgi:galactokinase